MKPIRLIVALPAIAIAIVALAYVAGLAGVGAANPDQQSLPEAAADLVATLRASDGSDVSVVRYEDDSSLCVRWAHGESCTKMDATVPMVKFVEVGDVRDAVILDPQQRTSLVRLHDSAGTERSYNLAVGDLAILVPTNDIARLEVVDVSGETTFAFEFATLDALRRLGEDAKDIEPHH